MLSLVMEEARVAETSGDLRRLGRRLKAARADTEYKSTQQVEAALKRRGIDVSSVQLGRFERGEAEPRAMLLVELSLLYGVPFGYLVEPALPADAQDHWRRLNR